MKFFGYVFRNGRRNPIRSMLTIASVSVCLFLMMILWSFQTINGDVAADLRNYNRIVVMSSQGFAQPVPIALVNQIKAMDGVLAASPFAWYGGKFGEESVPFAQFAVDPQEIFSVYAGDIKVPPDQLKAFQGDLAGCIVGRKLAEDHGWKIGDRVPLRGDIYPFDLDLTIRGFYDASPKRNLRICFFNWNYLDEGLKSKFQGRMAGNAGTVMVLCKDAATMPRVSKAIDDMTKNSDSPTKTQTEEAFISMFTEMLGDMRYLIMAVGAAVVASLLCVAAVAMAMSMRERTTEIAVLKAIGYSKGLVLGLVLSEAILVAGLGGVLGAIGSKLLFDAVDIAPFTGGFLPVFYVPWVAALSGLAVSGLIGLLSGLIPAFFAANSSVINGLRKVV